jgi:thiol-disulfide isomerase/thioredoxin
MKLKILLFLLFFSNFSFAYEFIPFEIDTRKAIEAKYLNQPLIISFWSIDCPYCIDDLKKLGKVLTKNKNIKLITVCVDGKESAKKAERILSQANLPKHEQYQYAEVDEDKLRYSIDPNWYGELPRTYFYDVMHQVIPLSGKISTVFLDKWFKNNSIN